MCNFWTSKTIKPERLFWKWQNKNSDKRFLVSNKSDQWQSYKLKDWDGLPCFHHRVKSKALSGRPDRPVCMCVPWRNGPVKDFKWALDRCQQSFRKDKSVHAIRYFPCSKYKYRRKLSGRTGKKIETDGARKREVHVEGKWIPTYILSLFCLLFFVLSLLFSLSACRDS